MHYISWCSLIFFTKTLNIIIMKAKTFLILVICIWLANNLNANPFSALRAFFALRTVPPATQVIKAYKGIQTFEMMNSTRAIYASRGLHAYGLLNPTQVMITGRYWPMAADVWTRSFSNRAFLSQSFKSTEEIRSLQAFLNNKYDAKLIVDGILGQKTQTAWVKYINNYSKCFEALKIAEIHAPKIPLELVMSTEQMGKSTTLEVTSNGFKYNGNFISGNNVKFLLEYNPKMKIQGRLTDYHANIFREMGTNFILKEHFLLNC
jgi:hypothetical protein